ncbi:MAG: outer membrane protein assembly factor BamA [Deltaproteobacteria bacterium RIFCSPLOWO2_02_FULL_50_16]|nr:MAG: outer membrane protein assembly factor BamA [Deltaproteobacteria bacterium GWA2_50_8]OGQ25684.1 MAG: outer membrane protein assembly factor BamA [Deltaproteobacteria bacterium RIFCSPHIGHO2_02_FULL_50_15]OGQ56947.1 MAG: outer membrane protein assembly factor BamA [Deltaproteobacteria bacterium RIFCSPLOWO2_02_FULL_50_16]OGQ68025.1 MAG: outer membrane protein assembly factor BamA [Deltaproteobacteria bacterium RIFCSPLOWO2_12_FULL_50_11]
MKKTVLIFFVIIFCLVGIQEILASSVKIKSIEVQGNRSIQKSTILMTIKSHEGSVFDKEQISSDIRALYRLGLFQDIQVVKDEAPDGMKLIFVIKEKGAIGKITIEGHKKIKEEKIREKIVVKVFKPADPAMIQASIQAIQEHYAKEGYHLAAVTTELKPIPDSSDQELIFRIKENQGLRVKRINFIGNKAFSDKELRKVIRTKGKGYFSWLSSSGKFSDEAVERDVLMLTFHYLNHGYIKVKVSSPKIYLSKDKKWLYITFNVTEGLQYRLRSVDMEGDILTTKQELISKLIVKPGQIYSRMNIEKDMQLLSQIYGDQGYAFTNINPATLPDDTTRTADLIYRISKGSKVYIEKINIIGNMVTRDKVIRRELAIKENALYNESRLQMAKRKLEQLGYFEEVNFATPRGSRDDTLVLNITVKEKPTGTFTIGAGFSSVENFIFNASIAKDNFLGYGLKGQFSVELSSRRQLFVFSLEDPYFLDTNWILGLSAFRTVYAFEDFDREAFGGNVSFGRRFFDYSSTRLIYEIEKVNATDFSTTVPALFENNLEGLTSSLALELNRDTRDNRLFPSKGFFHSVANEFAGVGGDNDFYRFSANSRFYQPVFWKVIFKTNVSLAYITSLNNQPVPLFERFFLGGINSLRGFFPRSVGPKVRVPADATGGDSDFVIGGNKMIQLNGELELPIYDPIGFKFVTFVDAGNAFAEDENYSLRQLRSDYGFGLRWNSPFGPLRFEWGIPIKREPGEDSVVFNFTIGSFF